MNIWYPNAPDPDALDRLRELVAPNQISKEPIGDTEMLIDGRPTREQLQSCPSLRWLVVPFAGVPTATLKLMEHFPQVGLHNLHHNAPHTTETALTLLLAAAKQTVPSDQAMRKHDWGWRYTPDRTTLLSGKTAVLVGYGAIGQRIATVLRTLEMRVQIVRRTPSGPDEYGPDQLMNLLPNADVLILAAALTKETEGMIGADQLAAMPQGAILVNIARAPIVDEEALYLALKSGHLHSAGLDVWYHYPASDAEANHTPPSRFPFHDLPNVVMSPHRGGMSAGTEPLRVEHLSNLILAASTGQPVPNQVDLAKGY